VVEDAGSAEEVGSVGCTAVYSDAGSEQEDKKDDRDRSSSSRSPSTIEDDIRNSVVVVLARIKECEGLEAEV
jgi:hypothetical protein